MSKITRPILSGVFSRKRLFSLLDRMRKHPLIWVSGPPGCGKTTLVASYLEVRKLPCLWYQIDQGDTDPATFFFYLGQAAKRASPKKRKPLPLLTPEYLQDVPTFTYRYFEELYSRLIPPHPPLQKGGMRGNFEKGGPRGDLTREGVKGGTRVFPPLKKGDEGGFIIVFDNYQEVPANSPFHEVILNGLSRIPEGINVILISRTEPPPALIRLRANNLMGNLGWEELRLNPEESGSIVRSKTRQKLPKETIRHLHNTTDGWAAGLILMLESMKRGIEPQMLGKLTPDEIVDYFGKELFDKTDKEIQEFFLKTAFLPRMTAKMAETLTDLPHASRILSTLSRNNYFTERRFHKEPIYQYHPLYRDFLLLRARETFSQDTLLTLLRRAAKLLEEDGQTESAASLLKDINDWDSLIQLISKHAPLMVAQGRYRPLEDWLNSLPMDILENNPWLFYWRGECRLPFDFSLSRSFFEKAFNGFKNQKETTGMFQSWSALVYSIWQEGKDFSPFDHWVQVLEELRREVKEFPSAEIGARVASMMVSILIARQPWHPELDAWADRAFSLAEACPNTQVRINTLFQVAFYRFITGQMGKASHIVSLLRQLLRSRNAPPLTLLMGKYMEAYFYRFIGMHEEVLRVVSGGLELSQKTGVHAVDHWFWGQGAASALNVQDFKAAGNFLKKVEASLPRLTKWNQFLYHMQRTRQALAQKDTRQASLHADMALKLANDVGSPLSHAFALIMKAHVMHELGKHKEAIAHLSQASRMATRANNNLQKFYILLARSRFAFDERKEASGISFLREALVIGRKEEIIETFIDHPPTMSMLCGRALDAGIELEYVQEIIKKRKLTPEKPHLDLENWPWPLKVFTLGRFELIKDGKPIQFQRKAQQKPLSMLKALIAFGGRDVQESKLADALWPEADGDDAHHSFVTNLHRLRQLVGHDKTIQLREGKLTLDDRYCWVDVWAFERILRQAEEKQKDGLTENTIRLIEKALEMYKGPFLTGEIEQAWMISLRERLRSKFLWGVTWLGHCREKTERWEKAIQYYQRGIEVDDVAEDLYQHLMTCYQRLGRRNEALSVYSRLKRTLSAVLGVEPSPKTEAVYKSLLT